MLRIVGVQRSTSASGEFVLLQNQGSIRVNLKGHVLMSDSAFRGGALAGHVHALSDEVFIPPGMYVLLSTTRGKSKWGKSRDGTTLYFAFMGCGEPVWTVPDEPIHLLSTQHTFADRKDALLVH